MIKREDGTFTNTPSETLETLLRVHFPKNEQIADPIMKILILKSKITKSLIVLQYSLLGRRSNRSNLLNHQGQI